MPPGAKLEIRVDAVDQRLEPAVAARGHADARLGDRSRRVDASLVRPRGAFRSVGIHALSVSGQAAKPGHSRFVSDFRRDYPRSGRADAQVGDEYLPQYRDYDPRVLLFGVPGGTASSLPPRPDRARDFGESTAKAPALAAKGCLSTG